MMLSCILVDDEYLALQVLQTYAADLPDLQIKGAFKDPRAAVTFLKTEAVDVLFLDIQMPYLDGFSVLQELDKPPLVIFTTARHDFAVKAFDIQALDYLVKPIEKHRFEQAVIRAKDQLTARQKTGEVPILEIQSDYKKIRIAASDILCVEGFDEYVKIHTRDKLHITLAALKDILKKLPAGEFVQVHKSFLVNLREVNAHNATTLTLNTGQKVPIGRKYREEVKNMLNGKMA